MTDEFKTDFERGYIPQVTKPEDWTIAIASPTNTLCDLMLRLNDVTDPLCLVIDPDTGRKYEPSSAAVNELWKRSLRP